MRNTIGVLHFDSGQQPVDFATHLGLAERRRRNESSIELATLEAAWCAAALTVRTVSSRPTRTAPDRSVRFALLAAGHRAMVMAIVRATPQFLFQRLGFLAGR